MGVGTHAELALMSKQERCQADADWTTAVERHLQVPGIGAI
jgi:hypothetical protein